MQARAYGRTSTGGRRHGVLVEFVSANPTGPLHVGHGRHAAFGASLANLLDAAGFAVQREYYINDAGRQMEILAASVWLRYLESFGEQFPFPEQRLSGDYIRPIADKLVERAGRTLLRPAAAVFADLPPDAPAGDKDDYIDAVIARPTPLLGTGRVPAGLRPGAQRHPRRHPRRPRTTSASATTAGSANAAWPTMAPSSMRSTCCVGTASSTKKTGPIGSAPLTSATRRIASSCARTAPRPTSPPTLPITCNKCERGFDQLIDVLGSDHHGYIARVRAGLVAMGQRGRLPRRAADAVRDAVSRRRERCRCRRARVSSSRCANCAAKSATMRRASFM